MNPAAVPYSNPAKAQFRAALVLCRRQRKNLSPVIVEQSCLPSSFGKTNRLSDLFSFKSAAQVETLVGPQMAPPKSCGLKPKRKRASPVKVRLSEAERETVRATAAKAHLSVNAFIRYLLLGADYDPTLREQLCKANLELTRQGNNLNQIAKRLNGGKASEAEADSLLGILARSMLQTHKAIRAALTHGKGPEP